MNSIIKRGSCGDFMAIEKLDNYRKFEIYKAIGPFAEERLELYNSLVGLSMKWGASGHDVAHRFHEELITNAKKSEDIAYICFNPITDKVIGDVIVSSDKQFPKIGVINLIRTMREYRQKGICKKLFNQAVEDWHSNRDKLLLLHTNNKIASDIYKKAGFRVLYGTKPQLEDGSEKGAIMLHTGEDKRALTQIVGEYFNGSGELTVEPMTRADIANFELFAGTYQEQSEDWPIPMNLSKPSIWNPESRFRRQFIFGEMNEGNNKDILLALKTKDGKIVGVRTITYPNKKLSRTKKEDNICVLEQYIRGTDLLAKIKL